jgi:uncharacterized protein YjdB
MLLGVILMFNLPAFAGSTVSNPTEVDVNTATLDNGYWVENSPIIRMTANTVTVTATYKDVYILTVINGSGSGDYKEGTKIIIKADDPPAGQEFVKWICTTEDGVILPDNSGIIRQPKSASTTLKMPVNNLTITPIYEDKLYNLTVINGTGSGVYKAGTKVTITSSVISSDKIICNWTTRDGGICTNAGKTGNTFITSANEVTVTVEYKDVVVKPTGVKTLSVLYLVKGKTATLPGAVQPYDAADKSVTWKSANSNIATVDDNGEVKGVNTGKVTVTFSTNDGKKTAICTVYVVNKATALKSLDKLKDAKLDVGETMQVTPTIQPVNATGIVPAYISSSTVVAVINKAGIITALSPGKANITVTVGKLKQTFTLTVK